MIYYDIKTVFCLTKWTFANLQKFLIGEEKFVFNNLSAIMENIENNIHLDSTVAQPYTVQCINDGHKLKGFFTKIHKSITNLKQ